MNDQQVYRCIDTNGIRQIYRDLYLEQMTVPLKLERLGLLPKRQPPTRWQRFGWWLKGPYWRAQAWIHRDCGGD